ncbi:MAG: Cof-type HAD-IIB family hydrolase [Eubacteriales bacterium]
MFKLLALDIDGTLVKDTDEISSPVKKAIFEVKEQGIDIVLLSGRNYFGMKPYVEELRLSTLTASANGTVIVDVIKDQIVYEETIDIAVAKEIALEAKKRGLLVINMSGYNIQTEDFCHAPKEIRNFMHFNFMIIEDVIACIEAKRPNKISVAGDYHILKEFRSEYLSQFKDIFNMEFGMKNFLEIYSNKAGKGNALEYIAHQLGHGKEHIISIGDSENDIDMFKASGCSVAMGNARDLVKSHADYITQSVEENGAAAAIEKFILRRIKEESNV